MNELQDFKKSLIKKETHVCKYCGMKFRCIKSHRYHEANHSKKL